MKSRKIMGLLCSGLLFVQAGGMVLAQEAAVLEVDAWEGQEEAEPFISEAPERDAGEEGPAVPGQTGAAEAVGTNVSGSFMQSGSLEMAKPDCAGINAKYASVLPMESKYAVKPSVTAPYAIGKLSSSNLQNGLTYTNFIRYVANLPEVKLGTAENEAAQYGAVLLAAIKDLSHNPDRPSNMPEAFYKKGYEATSSSNIASGYATIANAVQGFMNDNSSNSNIETLGHRRWILYPTLWNTGFGYAENGRSYITMKVFRCEETREYVDYDFISWPASGYFPNDVFADYGTPWSITVNPDKYQSPSLEDLKITVTRASDGREWFMDQSTGDGSKLGKNKMFLHVNKGGYGVSNCIIFNLGLESNANKEEKFNGIFMVKVDGLKTVDGEDASIRYAVNFFKLGTEAADEIQDSDLPFYDIPADAGNWKYESVKYVWENGIMGVGDSDRFRPDEPMTRAMFATVLYRMAGSPAVTFESEFSDVEGGKWYSDAITWAKQNGIVNGYTDGSYGINHEIKRQEIAKMLCLYGRVQGYDVGGRASLESFSDVEEVRGWAEEYMQWAVDAAMVSGKPNGDGTYRLAPKDFATRVECAKMLMKFRQKYAE